MTLLFIYLTVAIGVSFLCSVLEAVLLSITPSYVEQIAAQQSSGGKVVLRVKEHLDESISSILILNTFAHTMGATGVGAQASQIFGAKWETLIAVILTLAILYFSEIIPKTLGATFWRQLAIPSAHIITWLIKLVYPLLWFSTLLTRVFSKKIGNEYLTNALQLREIKTEQILMPRSVVHSLNEEMTVSQSLEDEKSKQFSRIPLYNVQNEITGMVINRDLYEA